MARKHSLAQLMSDKGLDIKGLAAQGGVSTPTARRAVRGDVNARPNTTSATKIADALGVDVGDINWPGGLANGGRPAGTGGTYTPRRPRP